MPPYNLFLGHLPLMMNLISNLPKDAHGHYLPDQIRRRFPDLGPIYYLDAWPFATPILVVTSPYIAPQFSSSSNLLPKHPGMAKYVRPITGGLDLISMSGETWKAWRKIFNPGFSANQMIEMVPAFLEEIQNFRDILREHTKAKTIFRLDEAAINLTMDVIGRLAL